MTTSLRFCRLPRRHPRHPQRGIAMIELLGALAIGTMILLGLSTMMDGSVDDMKGQQAGYYQSQVAAAAEKYISANAATLQGLTPTAATVATVSLAQLKTGRFLPGGMAATNVYRQTPCVLVRQPDPAGAPGKFDVLVVTTGGGAIPEKDLPAAAMNAGPGGGYISTGDTANAKGATWSLNTSAYRSTACPSASALSGGAADGGHLVSNLFTDGSGMLSTDYLYRNAVPGHPELNRMNTPIRMANAALVSNGASCLNASGVAEPGVALDSGTRALLTCSSGGVWSSYSQWKEPVSTYASLPSGSVGDVRMVTSLARAFMYDGSSWRPLAIDQDGNFDVPGRITTTTLDASQDITARQVAASQNISAGGTITASGDISSGGSMWAGYDVNAVHAVNSFDVNASHNVVAQGVQALRWMESEAITIFTVMTPGTPCHYLQYDPIDATSYINYPMGTIVMDANYRPLICGADKTMRYANGTYSP